MNGSTKITLLYMADEEMIVRRIAIVETAERKE
jgi:hypothetical protein